MLEFSYTAIDSLGKRHKGRKAAESKGGLQDQLASQGLIALKIEQISERKTLSSPVFFGRVTADELMLFTRQLGVMLRTGVPILQALAVLERQVQSLRFKEVLQSMQNDIQHGLRISQSMARHPKVFDELYCALVRAGEESGALDQILPRLSQMISHEQKVKKDVKTALRYPQIVLSFLCLAFVIILTFVMPRLVDLFTKSGVELPLPTRVCVSLGEFLKNYWYWLLAGVSGTIVAVKFGRGMEKVKYFLDLLVLKMPYINELVLKAVMCRFAYIFAVLNRSGIPILQSLDILADVVGNRVVAKEFRFIRQRVEEGDTISAGINDSPYFTEVIGSMVGIGEQSGSLEELLTEVADFYDEELKYAIQKLTDIIPVIMTVAMTFVVGFFMAAVFLPLFRMGRVAGGLK